MAAPSTFKKILEPFQIKNVGMKNRIVKPATWLVYPNVDGTPGLRASTHYETLAKGGVGELHVIDKCDNDELSYVGGAIRKGAFVGMRI